MRVFERGDQLGAAGLRLRMVVFQQVDAGGARQGRHAGLVLQHAHGLRQLRAVAVRCRQRQALQGGKFLLETLAQEAVVGARPRVNDLILVAGAAKEGVAAAYQHRQQTERRFVQVMQFIGHDDLEGRQLLAQRLVAVEHAHEVVGGVERGAELDVARVGAAQAFVFAQPQIMRARHAQHFQVVIERVALEVRILEIQARLGAQLQFQEFCDGAVGRVDFQRVAVRVFLGDHFQRFPGHGAQLFIAAHGCHLHVFQLQQHLGGEGVEGIDGQALDDAERHAHFQQALAQGHARRFREDEGQHAFGGAAPVQGFGQAQGQGRRLGRAGIGVDQDDLLLRRLDGDLLRRGRDAFGNELRGVICTQRNS